MAKKYISMREKSRTPIQKRRLSYPPFGQVTDEFLMVQKGRGNRPATLKHYEGTIRKLKKFLVWEYMPDEFETMEEDDILINGGTITCDVLNERRFEGRLRDFLLDIECVSEVTVSTYFRDYRAIAYWLMDEGIIASRQISFKNEEGDIKSCYTDKEISRLLKKPERNCSFTEYRSWVVVHWLLGTGNRISTVCNIKIDDIDFTNSMIDINVQKSRRKHRIPLDSKLRTVLQEYIKEWLTDDQGEYVSPYLFPNSYIEHCEQPISRSALTQAIAAYNISRGVSKTSVHLFRHTFTKIWIVNNGDLHSLQKILGHSTLDMVTKYANLWGEDLKPKIEQYGALSTQKQGARGHMIQRRGHR